MKHLQSSTPVIAIMIAAVALTYQERSDAAVQVVNNVIVSSDIGNSLATALPHIVANKGSAVGVAAAFTVSVPSPGSLTYQGDSTLLTGGDGNGNNSQNFANTVTHSVSFSLGANETVDIALTGIYTLTSAILSSEVSWVLTDPMGGNVWAPKSFTSSGTVAGDNTLNGSINESVLGVTSAAGGTYTLTMVNRTFGTTTSKVANMAEASFTNLSFTVTAVPEPSSTMVLGALGVMLLSIRRRKWNVHSGFTA